ncbi:MAG TPA: hypothetical protein VFF04_00100 [Candidatus Babeliales bacterium]|nr:hypothetical protein [Candidatus Babeliales bacterium]
MIDPQAIQSFKHFIWQFYILHQRSFAWRHVDDPYKVLVSEVMLQQTQTYRVETKYEEFITTFPDFESLASAQLRDVLAVWQGLGYNRRGKFLHSLAQQVVQNYHGKLPDKPEELVKLPGIGKATAASICAFAFNKPTVFIETNIRAVYIHSFFKDKQEVHDNELFPLVQATVDQNNPREWYYALMDYGVYLKKLYPNPSRRSAHHTTQSRFEGSDRQIRGFVLKLLTQHSYLTLHEIVNSTKKESARVEKIVNQLCAEGFIIQLDGSYKIV